MSHGSKYQCKYCNKVYSTSQSRSNHYKLYHKNASQSEVSIVGKSSVSLVNTYPCRFCKKEYLHKQSRFNHEQKCKDKELLNTHILKEENKQIKEQNKKIEEEMKELKIIVSNLSKKNTSQQVINVNGNINTAYNINSLGYEKYKGKLTETDKLNLLTGLRHQELPIVELVKKIYNEDSLVENRNTIITNLRSKDCLVYNSYTNKFEATNKSNHIDDIIKNRKDDLASMYKEFEGTTKLKGFERRVIEEYLEKIEGINKKDKKLKALYEKHKEEIIYIIYNCKEFMESIKDQLSELVDTIEV